MFNGEIKKMDFRNLEEKQTQGIFMPTFKSFLPFCQLPIIYAILISHDVLLDNQPISLHNTKHDIHKEVCYA